MSFGGGSSGGGGTQIIKQDPYDPAKPALNQIISEAGNLYGQGVKAAGYVAPSQQTTRGLAAQELMADASTQQLADTLSGKYLNPFLSPMLQDSANQIATAVNTEFSGAGRTPGSAMNQQQILSGIASEAIPFAFDQYERERQRQLGIASSAPSLVSPIAAGLPVRNQDTTVNPNRVTQAMGGALIGNMIMPGIGGAIGGALLGGLL